MSGYGMENVPLHSHEPQARWRKSPLSLCRRAVLVEFVVVVADSVGHGAAAQAQARAAFTRSGVMGSSRIRRPVA